jgi:MFS family permease
VFIFGLVLTFLISEMSLHIIAAILILAGILCFLAAINFLYLEEQPGSVKGGQNALNGIIKRMNAVLTDKQFLLFLLTRACLVCTAIAPPFILMLPGYAQQQISGDTVSLLDALAVFPDGVSQELGLLILASSLSGTLSSPLWGRLSDNSSKTVLLITAVITLVLNIVIVLCLLYRPELFSSLLVLPVLLFVIMTAHHGVRIGRSTHLVDMSDENNRANYTAVSNTIMGIFLTGSILFGFIANTFGLTILFMVFACLSVGALITASLLKHVQDSD